VMSTHVLAKVLQLIVGAVGISASPRCRWGERFDVAIFDYTDPGATLTHRIARNTSEAECKALCDDWSDCKSINFLIGVHIDSGDWSIHSANLTGSNSSQCDLLDCGISFKCFSVWASFSQGVKSSHFECNEQPIILIAGVLALSAFVGALTSAAVYCFAMGGPCVAAVTAAFAASAVALLGLIPVVASANPILCAEVYFHEQGRAHAYFPIALIGAGGSVVGLAIACTKLGSTGWRCLPGLAKTATMYFVAATISNALGATAAMTSTCMVLDLEANDFHRLVLAAWASGTFASNLILQKLLVDRAHMLERSRSSTCLHKTYRAELAILLLAVVSVFISFMVQVLSIRDPLFWALHNSVQGLLVVAFWLLDLVFSCLVCRIILNSLRSVQLSKASSTLSGEDTLVHAVSVAKLNLATICISVSTTTLFYIAVILGLALQGSASAADSEAAVILSLFLDSISNDVCAIIVGFGSTDAALQIVNTAQNADVIGNPLPHTSSHAEASVVGHVVPPTSESAAHAVLPPKWSL